MGKLPENIIYSQTADKSLKLPIEMSHCERVNLCPERSEESRLRLPRALSSQQPFGVGLPPVRMQIRGICACLKTTISLDCHSPTPDYDLRGHA